MPPPTKQVRLHREHIRSDLLNEELIGLIRSTWTQTDESVTKLKDSGIELLKYPFPVCIVQDFISNTHLLKAVINELKHVNFNEKSNDLYQFKQSDDVINLDKFISIQDLYACFRQDGRLWLSKIFGNIELKETISATFSSYSFQDRLLCHDDKCGDRHIAFIFYLVEDWRAEDGGTLQLFSANSHGHPKEVVKNIIPKYNSLVFFEVSYMSFHQVAEVLTRNKNRISLNGWFHLDKKSHKDWNCKKIECKKIFGNDEHFKLDEYFKPDYFESNILEDISCYFAANSETELLGFLQQTFLDKISDDLRNQELIWLSKGPPNIRKYEVADMSNLPSNLQMLKNIFESKVWFNFLKMCTKLDFAPSKTSDLKIWECGILPQCTFEIQRWVHSSYTLISDEDPEFDSEGLDVVLRLPVASTVGRKPNEEKGIPAGHIVYIDGESKEEECLLHLGDKTNCLALIFRDAKTLRFTKYLHSETEPFYQIFCTYYQWQPPTGQPNLKHYEDESTSEGSLTGIEEDSDLL